MEESGDGSERALSPRLSGENLMRGSGGRLRPERRENFNTERGEQGGGRREGWRGGVATGGRGASHV